MTFPINSPDNAVANAYAAIRADNMRIAKEWADARTPWQAVAQRCSPETRARRAALFAALERAKRAWVAANPGATPAEYEAAMRSIAKRYPGFVLENQETGRANAERRRAISKAAV